VPQNPLNDHVRHPESVEIAPETAARRVPPVPLRDATVTLVGMFRLLVVGLSLPTYFTAVESGQNDPVSNTAECYDQLDVAWEEVLERREELVVLNGDGNRIA
jgi:hypothetical protein